MKTSRFLCTCALAVALTGFADAQITLDYCTGTHLVPEGSYSDINLEGDAVVSMGTGVEANQINIYSSEAIFHVSGGAVGGAENYGLLAITGGSFSGSVTSRDNAVVTMSGGSVAGNFTLRDSAVAFLSGGSVGDESDVVVSHQSVFNWSGGEIGLFFDLVGESTWNVYGSAFTFGGTGFSSGGPVTRAGNPLLFAPDGSYDYAAFTVTLADGSTDTLTVLASNGENPSVPEWTGTINFIAIPEPPQVAALASLAAWATVMLRRRVLKKGSDRNGASKADCRG